MFGLPSLTVELVGGVVLLILVGLLYWGLQFREVKI
jgi:hypothetical protein